MLRHRRGEQAWDGAGGCRGITISYHSPRTWCGAQSNRLMRAKRLSLTLSGGHVLLACAAGIGELVPRGGIFELLGIRKGRRVNTSRCLARHPIGVATRHG